MRPWLSSSTAYNPNSLLDFFDDDEVSKAALIDVLRVHKQDLSVHDLLRRARDEGTLANTGKLRDSARFLTTTFQALNIAAQAGRSRWWLR